MEKFCYTCKHYELPEDQEPCKSCPYTKAKWQPRDGQPKFKIGDRARVVDDSATNVYKNGDIVTIAKVFENEAIVKSEGKPSQCFQFKRLEPFTGFRVGDRARVVALGEAMEGFSIGDIVAITETPPRRGNHDYEVKKTANGYIGYCNADHLEPLSADYEPRDGIDMITAFARLLLFDRGLLESLVYQVEDACEEAKETIADLLDMSAFDVSIISQFEGVKARWHDRMTASEEKIFKERLHPYREAIKKELTGRGYIPAIKLCRQMTGWGLRRAKGFVDLLRGEASQ